MPAPVSCPDCLELLSVPTTKLGTKVKCRACGKVFIAEEPRKSAKGGKKKRKSQASGMGWIAPVAGLSIVAVAIAAFFLLKGKTPATDTPQAATVPNANSETVAPATAIPTGTGAASTTGTATAAGSDSATSGAWLTADPQPAVAVSWIAGSLPVIVPDKGAFQTLVTDVISPFFLLKGVKSIQVGSLQQGIIHRSELPKDMVGEVVAVSPDGRHFAVQVVTGLKLPTTPPANGTPAAQAPKLHVEVWSGITGRFLFALPELPDVTSFQWFEFNTADTLTFLTLNTPSRTWEFHVCDLATQSIKHRIPIQQFIHNQTLRLTPGGRYVAGVLGFTPKPNQLFAVDLSEGKLVGTADTHDPVYKSVSFTGMAFSSDGKELAILQRYEDAFRVLILDAFTGKRVSQTEIPGVPMELLNTRIGGDSQIAWMLDRKHLVLFDGLVVDRVTGATVADVGNLRGKATKVTVLGDRLIQFGTPDEKIRVSRIEVPQQP